MTEATSAAAFVPESDSLKVVAEAAQHCRGCPLYRYATQTVFGEGPQDAELVIVGEQPGDQEDRQGRPFVGPAGRILNEALTAAGIERSRAYVTNAVKHFKFETFAGGKRRIHKKPGALEIRACHPWLQKELDLIKPRLIVAMGATAAQSLLGRSVTIHRERGRFLEHPQAEGLLVTIHPSSLLRIQDNPRLKEEEMAAFVEDFKKVRQRLRGRSQASRGDQGEWLSRAQPGTAGTARAPYPRASARKASHAGSGRR